jgi:hypothetical protein
MIASALIVDSEGDSNLHVTDTGDQFVTDAGDSLVFNP